ncbi:MAG: hypothetical protein JSW48_06115 [Betaproteobacteria bacterium]|jgi:hypothetical protein|nr:MAG: hypothetical protein JSW48_06115 [Betaproteobacteria bacterium]
MPDYDTRSEKWRAGEPLRIGRVTLLPIERVSMRAKSAAAHAWLTACKEPLALVVRDAQGIRAIEVTTALSIERLRDEIPELDDLITLW